jgi:hypothetical protein
MKVYHCMINEYDEINQEIGFSYSKWWTVCNGHPLSVIFTWYVTHNYCKLNLFFLPSCLFTGFLIARFDCQDAPWIFVCIFLPLVFLSIHSCSKDSASPANQWKSRSCCISFVQANILTERRMVLSPCICGRFPYMAW